MPGPGGGGGFSGGGGGGFHGGGGFSGGGGGGFHGGHHGPPPPHHHHYHYGRPYYGGYYGRGGGCFGGLFAMVFSAIICVIFAVVLFVVGLGIVTTDLSQGGSVVYDEGTFQTYANDEYAKAFGGSGAYEDNVLIVILSNEDYSDYYCIAWVGDDLNQKVTSLITGEEFRAIVRKNINSTNYHYSLSVDIRNIFEDLDESIVAKMGTESCFRCEENHVGSKESKVINRTDMSINVEQPNAALKKFTEDTEIPVVVVVNTAEAVFGRTKSIWSTVMIIGGVVLVIIAIGCIIGGVRRRRSRE